MITIVKYLFYFMAFMPILFELKTLIHIKRAHQFSLETKSLKGKEFEDWPLSQRTYAILSVGYFIWAFVGLFTFQWPIFLGFILISFIPKKFVWFRWLDSLLSLIVLLFVVLNAFHFKVDVWSFLIN